MQAINCKIKNEKLAVVAHFNFSKISEVCSFLTVILQRTTYEMLKDL